MMKYYKWIFVLLTLISSCEPSNKNNQFERIKREISETKLRTFKESRIDSIGNQLIKFDQEFHLSSQIVIDIDSLYEINKLDNYNSFKEAKQLYSSLSFYSYLNNKSNESNDFFDQLQSITAKIWAVKQKSDEMKSVTLAKKKFQNHELEDTVIISLPVREQFTMMTTLYSLSYEARRDYSMWKDSLIIKGIIIEKNKDFYDIFIYNHEIDVYEFVIKIETKSNNSFYINHEYYKVGDSFPLTLNYYGRIID